MKRFATLAFLAFALPALSGPPVHGPSVPEDRFEFLEPDSAERGDWVEYELDDLGAASREKLTCVGQTDGYVFIEYSDAAVQEWGAKAAVIATVRKSDRRVVAAVWGPGDWSSFPARVVAPSRRAVGRLHGAGKVAAETIVANGAEFDCQRAEVDLTRTRADGSDSSWRVTSWRNGRFTFRSRGDPVLRTATVDWEGNAPLPGTIVKQVVEGASGRTERRLVNWGRRGIPSMACVLMAGEPDWPVVFEHELGEYDVARLRAGDWVEHRSDGAGGGGRRLACVKVEGERAWVERQDLESGSTRLYIVDRRDGMLRRAWRRLPGKPAEELRISLNRQRPWTWPLPPAGTGTFKVTKETLKVNGKDLECERVESTVTTDFNGTPRTRTASWWRSAEVPFPDRRREEIRADGITWDGEPVVTGGIVKSEREEDGHRSGEILVDWGTDADATLTPAADGGNPASPDRGGPVVYDWQLNYYDLEALKAGDWVEYSLDDGKRKTRMRLACVRVEADAVWVEFTGWFSEDTDLYEVDRKTRRVKRAWRAKAGEAALVCEIQPPPAGALPSLSPRGSGKTTREALTVNGVALDCERAVAHTTIAVGGKEYATDSTTWRSEGVPFHAFHDSAAPVATGIVWDGAPSCFGGDVRAETVGFDGAKTTRVLTGWGSDAKPTIEIPK